MLKFNTTQWPPTPEEVAFSERSDNLLERDRDGSHHDRTRELGLHIGDLLNGSMQSEPAYEIADRLVADLDNEAQAEAFATGVGNTLIGYSGYREERAVKAESIDVNKMMTDFGPVEDGGAVGL